MSTPATVTSPAVGWSRPARMCMSVDLPEPDGPMTAVRRPRGDVDRDAAQRVDGGVALAVAADDVAGGDDGARARAGPGARDCMRTDCMADPFMGRAVTAPSLAGPQACRGAARAARVLGGGSLGAARAAGRCAVRRAGSEHGEDAAVVVLVRRQAELREDVGDVLLHAAPRDAQPLGDRLVRAALGDQLEHLALARASACCSGPSSRALASRPETTCGSSAEPPAATRRSVATKSSTSATRSLSR